jgi:hypothetical protein
VIWLPAGHGTQRMMLPRHAWWNAIALLALFATSARAGPVAQRPSVIELFTSQGCSSCPAADKLLVEYAKRKDIIALSLNVDYWDHLGWKDTLASAKYTKRQKAYAKSLGIGNVYTPQLVVNGMADAVGSSRPAIDKAIESVRAASTGIVPVKALAEGKLVLITIGAAPADLPPGTTSATVWLALVEPNVDVMIKRGENSGRTLSYHNVVRDLSPIGMWSGKPMRIELPADTLLGSNRNCAVFVQAGMAGRIIGAAWMDR